MRDDTNFESPELIIVKDNRRTDAPFPSRWLHSRQKLLLLLQEIGHLLDTVEAPLPGSVTLWHEKNRNTRRKLGTDSGPDDENARNDVLFRYPSAKGNHINSNCSLP